MDEDDDGSSSLSIPNESIDFDLVYSLHSFAATVEGQANVVKGDSLFLMDDSNSYWWLVRVLKTQEVGYIPAENIETPFERLARLNKHRNVDLASATQSELQSDLNLSASRLRTTLAAGAGGNSSSPLPPSNSPRTGNTVPNPLSQRRGLAFSHSLSVHRYPPAVWNEEEWLIEREERRATIISERGGDPDAEYGDYDDIEFEEEEEDAEWEVGGYEAEDRDLADEMSMMRRMAEQALAKDAQQAKDAASVPPPQQQQPKMIPPPMEPDDGMQWEDRAVAARQAAAAVPAARPAPEQQAQPALQQPPLRAPRSIERLTPDPAEATETRKVTMTPSLVREPVSPNTAELERESERERERKRVREEEEEAARKRAKQTKPVETKPAGTPMAAPVSSANVAKSPPPNGGGKLRKDREPVAAAEDDGKKKKSGSMFGRLFKGSDKKEKVKNASIGSESDFAASGASGRGSEESGRRPSNGGSASGDGMMSGMISPTTATALQQQQQQQATNLRNSTDPKRIQQMQQQREQQQREQQQQQQGQGTPLAAASQLRQRDQQQQALYQQYLNRSPSSPPEAQPSYGLQSAAPYMNSSSTPPSAFHSPASGGRQRPGSLILTPSSSGDGVGVPELSVIRVFAGQHLQTEATFKTVLLNASTTSADLVRQAVQRFRLEDTDPHEYFLTVKQVEGSSAVLRDTEHPLVVFEGLVENAPRVKRSSVGSVSSVASNLSMHPAIKKLDMNDFTDDSAVKFYLNRRGGEESGDVSFDGADDTLIAETVDGESDPLSPARSQFLTVSTAGGNNVQPERFTSPSFRFPLQLVIYPGDLPDDMVFDPLTEAIVFKDTLRERGRPSVTSPGISQTMRRKVFVFPKNATVAEVIEIGLERFGIEEGVVDGGDEVEDKLSKRRSAVRVRYQLTIDTGNGQERELSPSSRVVDSFPRPPTYRNPQTQFPNKRRSVDSANILGTMDDVNSDDPMFILRRATSYRPSTNSHARHRVSAGLDELALAKQKMQRDSASSTASDTVAPEESKIRMTGPLSTAGLSRAEIIAAQREATRANQRAILSASTNSVRGTDLLLPGNAMIRSARYNTDEKMRYSYVQPDGEAYDISDIVEAEWRDSDDYQTDVLEGVMGRNKDRVGEKLDRVLSKIQSGGRPQQAANAAQTSLRSASPESQYSLDDGRSRSVTPGSAGLASRPPIAAARAQSATGRSSPSVRPGTSTPTGARSASAPIHPGLGSRRQESVTSLMSDDISGYATPMAPSSPESLIRTPTPKAQQKRLLIPKDDFGVSQMMAVIEVRGSLPRKTLPPLDPVDEMLFGRPVDLASLHPKIRDVYADAFEQMDDMDKMLDDYLLKARR
ncbi:hypothetical protein K438DRAFT_1809021 [Mycena galopus ATCC 62051]|nr:hypothetical protein K438DRAFT_1809021 [Mycena galopus ATCC 62051]